MRLAAILRDVATELRTDRLLLRVPCPGDGDLVHAAVVDTLPALRAWPASLPWAMHVPSVTASETFCRESASAFLLRRGLVYLVFDAQQSLVGTCSLHSIDWALPKFELGFWCRGTRQRQGLATEATSALVRYAFDDLAAKRVEALTDEANIGSRRVCEAIGMQLEGVMRSERITPDGDVRNTCVYAIVK
jgi:RimJ/RimL family protein N-acetyltransferase